MGERENDTCDNTCERASKQASEEGREQGLKRSSKVLIVERTERTKPFFCFLVWRRV